MIEKPELIGQPGEGSVDGLLQELNLGQEWGHALLDGLANLDVVTDWSVMPDYSETTVEDQMVQPLTPKNPKITDPLFKYRIKKLEVGSKTSILFLFQDPSLFLQIKLDFPGVVLVA